MSPESVIALAASAFATGALMPTRGAAAALGATLC